MTQKFSSESEDITAGLYGRYYNEITFPWQFEQFCMKAFFFAFILIKR